VTQAFCRTCTRARLSTEACSIPAFSPRRDTTCARCCAAAPPPREISEAIARIWQGARDRYSEIRTAETAKLRKIEMSYIGGMKTPHRPKLTHASKPLTFEVEAINERGEAVPTPIAGEHPLTVYVDKRESSR